METKNRIATILCDAAEDLIASQDEHLGVFVIVFDGDGNCASATSLDNPSSVVRLLARAMITARKVQVMMDMEMCDDSEVN